MARGLVRVNQHRVTGSLPEAVVSSGNEERIAARTFGTGSNVFSQAMTVGVVRGGRRSNARTRRTSPFLRPTRR